MAPAGEVLLKADDGAGRSESNAPAETMRLNSFIARCGVESRRSADRLIRAGRVTVNGRTAEIGTQVDPRHDDITLDDRRLSLPDGCTTVLLHKPAGYLVSRRDPHHSRTIYELLPREFQQLVPVGRLDLDTEGAILLTDDGELVNQLTHPRYHVPKVYRPIVRGRPDEGALDRLRGGVEIDGTMTRPAGVSVVGARGDDTELEMVLMEGRKRQVRRMCEAVGHRVTYLARIQFAGLTLDGLKIGAWRELSDEEVASLAGKAVLGI